MSPDAEEGPTDLPTITEYILPVEEGKCAFPKFRLSHKTENGNYIIKFEDTISLEELQINPLEVKIEYFGI